MVEWYRHRAWDAEVAAAFEARLARARDKAQYLCVQAHELLASRPDVAADLCRRAIALGDEAQTARAGLYLGTALAVAGDFDGAIDALEQTMEAERRSPTHRTGAWLDHALLVGWAERAEHYDAVRTRLDAHESDWDGDPPIEALIARALVDGGVHGVAAARAALDALADANPDETELPAYLSVDELKRELGEAAGL